MALLAGCAGMPSVPGVPSVPGMPGRSSSSSGVSLQQVAQAAQAVTTATKDTSEAEEIEIGQGAAQGLLGAAPLLDNPRLQRYVNQVGRWVASQSERPDLPWQFGVLNDESVNAYAAPGGAVFITYGLMKKLQNEAELAGVLGHEIIHVVQKHHLNAMKQGGWADFAKVVGQGVVENKLGRTGVGQVINATGLTGAGMELVKQGFFLKPLDRGLEEESDRMGAILAARAGYDPYGLVGALQTLQAQPAAEDTFMVMMLKTHPSPTERIERLEAIAATLDRYQNQDQGRERFAAAMGLKAAPGARPAAAPAPAKPAATSGKPAAAKPAAKPGG
jgi:beta-barrel assembly-enhancing protease